MSRDPQRALMTALAAHLGPIDALTAKTRPWSSATFVGTQHVLNFSIAANDATRQALADLPEAELPMPHHFAADLRVVMATEQHQRLNLTLEILSIEAC